MKTGEKSSVETSSRPTTPPCATAKVTDNDLVIPDIKILNYSYHTPEKKPFELNDPVEVLPTHLTPTPDLDPFFTDESDQIHCQQLIQNLNPFPIKCSEQWLKDNFRQFKRVVNVLDLTRVKVLTNMWLQDGKEHTFPAKTPEDNHPPGVRSRLDKDFECEELIKKIETEKKEDIFSSLNCDISKIISSPERKSIVKSLKRVSSSLMTCQKLYASHFVRYEKQETEMFNKIMNLKMIEEEYSQKNLDLNIDVAKLKAEVEKLRFQMRQKNVHESNLRKTFLSQKKELKTLNENKILKLENDNIKLRSSATDGKNNKKLENDKLKDTIKSTKAQHKDQLRIKEILISDQNSTIKSLNAKIINLEKTVEKLNSKFVDYQHQSASNLAKLECKKELIVIKEKQKKSVDVYDQVRRLRASAINSTIQYRTVSYSIVPVAIPININII